MQLLLTILPTIFTLLSVAGGGGSSSSSSGGSDFSSSGSSSGGSYVNFDPGAIIFFTVVLFGLIIFYNIWGKKISKRQAKLSDELNKLAASDKAWNQGQMTLRARNVYTAYQRDWSNLDTQACKEYMTPHYFAHVELMLEAFRNMHRRNNVIIGGKSFSIKDKNKLSNSPIDQHLAVTVDSFNDAPGKDEDSFTASTIASVTDQLIDTDTNKMLYENEFASFEEWRFKRHGDQWLLDGITPSTATMTVREQQIQQFAANNSAYYSLDFGRLLLPTRGQLFRGSSFTRSDVNNHVIGRLQDSNHLAADGIIYQIYTYSATPANDGGKVYLIGQITVPKKYGDILIRKRKGLVQLGVSGMNEVQTEWSDFNKKYQVLADDVEQVTSFELLNPKMMELLEAQPFEINLEVIDNSIYFYAPLSKTSAENYTTMLTILQAAYRELKM